MKIISFARFVLPMFALCLMSMGSFQTVSAQDCAIPSSGPWPPCATGGAGGNGSTPAPAPSPAGVPCPTNGAWPAGCIPSSSSPSPAPAPSPGGGVPCPASGAWPAGCDPSLPPASAHSPSTPETSNPETSNPAPSNPTPSQPQPAPDWSPPDYVPPITHKLSQISTLPEGTDVVVKVQVVSTDSFRSGYRFGIADNTGRVTMITWHSVFDDCEQCNALNIGSELVLSGVTDSYQGETQIVPLYGGAIRVTKPSFIPGRLVPVGDLGKYVNQRAKIEGRITRVNRTNYGVELRVDDGSGEEELFFWSNNWQRVPNSWQLKPGAVIQAAGTVDEFRGRYTVTPPLPHDVTVITPAP